MDEELLWWYQNGGNNDEDDDYQKGSVIMMYLYEVDGTVMEMMLDESDFYNDGYDE